MRATVVALTLVFAFALTAIPTASQAQINPFKHSGMDLSAEDVELLKGAAGKLYMGHTAELGTVERWQNPATGNTGAVKLIKIFEYTYEGQQMPCRRMVHVIKIKGDSDPHQYFLNRCEVEPDIWKIL